MGQCSILRKPSKQPSSASSFFKRQTYTITNVVSHGDQVALEMDWIGVTEVQIQDLSPNSEMRDHAAVFLQFRDGRIARQRHYDCFEPW
jgi:ketosteroid isomerase-like protein